MTLAMVSPLIVTVLFGRIRPSTTFMTLTRVIASARVCGVTDTVAMNVAVMASRQNRGFAINPATPQLGITMPRYARWRFFGGVFFFDGAAAFFADGRVDDVGFVDVDALITGRGFAPASPYSRR